MSDSNDKGESRFVVTTPPVSSEANNSKNSTRVTVLADGSKVYTLDRDVLKRITKNAMKEYA